MTLPVLEEGNKRMGSSVAGLPAHVADATATDAQNSAGSSGLSAKLREVRDRYTMATPDKTDTPFAILTQSAESLDELVAALTACEAWIIALGDSGDAGFWDGRQTPEVIDARAAIAKATRS